MQKQKMKYLGKVKKESKFYDSFYTLVFDDRGNIFNIDVDVIDTDISNLKKGRFYQEIYKDITFGTPTYLLGFRES